MQNKINLDWFLGKGLLLNVSDVIFDSRTNNRISLVEKMSDLSDGYFDDDYDEKLFIGSLSDFNRAFNDYAFIDSFAWIDIPCVNLTYSDNYIIEQKITYDEIFSAICSCRYKYAKLLKMQNEDMKVEDKKVYYTQEQFDAGHLPLAGSNCEFKLQHQTSIYYKDCYIVGKSKCKNWLIFQDNDGILLKHHILSTNGVYDFLPSDMRTDEEKLIGDITEFLIKSDCDDIFLKEGTAKDIAQCLLTSCRFTITKKGK